MKAWITKYALTSGIEEVEAEAVKDNRMIRVRKNGSFDTYYHKPDWHETEPLARLRAEEMREKKIASLKKSLAKIKALTF